MLGVILLRERSKRINKISQELSKEAYKSYAGKKDYKRALEIYALLSSYNCIPKNISDYSKSMMLHLSKKIEERR